MLLLSRDIPQALMGGQIGGEMPMQRFLEQPFTHTLHTSEQQKNVPRAELIPKCLGHPAALQVSL